VKNETRAKIATVILVFVVIIVAVAVAYWIGQLARTA